MPSISLAEIETTTQAALEAHGADTWIAQEVAKAVRKAEAVSNRICGLYYLESYCQQLETGRVNGKVEPTVSRPQAGRVVVDAKYGFAQSAFSRGLPEAVSAAKENGI
ncbi:MAG: Ldh family oxidoreductase, partial [Proteobacteria bacterium]|nr:Ldh family oxidoreductase [Pseudomonadota bacterium]